MTTRRSGPRGMGDLLAADKEGHERGRRARSRSADESDVRGV